MGMHAFSRTELIIGSENLKRLYNAKVAIFGIGGVGSFAAEGLARCGIGKLILVDYDNICITNLNRQIHALRSTVGKAKVNVMKERILDINPDAEVEAYQMMYTKEVSERLLSQEYDYVVDAIDMVSAKIDLIEQCYALGIPVISSMGAGNKLDPTKLTIADIYQTSICPLAKIVRKELRKRGIPSLKVVYSKEQPIKPDARLGTEEGKRVPGSISFVPSVAGLMIASAVVNDLIEKDFDRAQEEKQGIFENE